MDSLEVEWLRKKEGKANVAYHSSADSSFPKTEIPAHCKIFSLSSCTSKAYLSLGEPEQAISLELFDKKGRRKAHIARNEAGRKVQPKRA